jgi:ribosomal protein L11 methylase PrmA
MELAASYNGSDPFTDLRIRELSSLMKFESSRVFDIGFGRAHFLYRLKKLGAIPYGLEVDPQAIEFAKFDYANGFGRTSIESNGHT